MDWVKFALCLLALIASFSHCASDAAGQPAKEPSPLVRSGGSVSGWVVAISGESLTLQGLEVEFRGATEYKTDNGMVTYFGKAITLRTPTKEYSGVKVVAISGTFRIFDAQGRSQEIREADQPARKFGFSRELTGGGFRKELTPATSYRVRDVKAGDRIAITYVYDNDQERCDTIRILKRPNGLVPPSPNDPANQRGQKYHDKQNAENELLDKLEVGLARPNARHLAPAPREKKR